MANFQFADDTSANWASVNRTPLEGELCYESDTKKLKFGDGSTTYTGLSYLATANVRTTSTVTTSSLAASASTTATSMPLAVGYRLYSVSTSRPARVRLYETAAAQTADSSRAVGTDPAGTAGVVFDFVTTAASTTYTLSPLVDGASLEATPSTSIPMTVTNMDTTTGTVAVTLTWLRTE